MVNLTDWAKTVVGRYIDVDKWVGNQCWDLAQAWLTACNGGTLWTQPSRFPGLAAGSWEVATGNTVNTADLLRHVTPIPGTERGLSGDIIIWAHGSPDYPISHTAVLMEDRGPILRSLSQNSSSARPDLPGYSPESSGPTIYQDLTRAGILGFLRPRTTITGQGSGITPIMEEGFLMTLSDADQIEVRDNLRKVVGTTADTSNLATGMNEKLDELVGNVRKTFWNTQESKVLLQSATPAQLASDINAAGIAANVRDELVKILGGAK
ncbi:hypothetical protein [Arthrobacter sp. GMC3]|uniref:hypothetical protein n=1 Tax=Arthrobacter sp. GMC3 TaxID=2058894 RepID=UPI000CE3300C|nr:hypothetical protein [Arthrobacter sp. GMC3]